MSFDEILTVYMNYDLRATAEAFRPGVCANAVLGRAFLAGSFDEAELSAETRDEFILLFEVLVVLTLALGVL